MNRVTMTAEWADERPDGLMGGMPAGSTHWRCTLRYQRRRMTIYFSMGPAHSKEPTAREVLECLLSDTCASDQPFEDWAADLGFDTDSRKAEKTYRTVVAQAEKLRTLLGDDFELYDDSETTSRRLVAPEGT